VSLASFIASTGENENFVAFMAHSGFAFFVLVLAACFHLPMLFVAGTAAVLAATKEFIFDPQNETAPPQNIWPDGALDFSGYATGIIVGFVIVKEFLQCTV